MIEQTYARSGKILVQGHRGALGRAPENTMPSFELGRNLGADLLELDVHLTKEGKLAVMHDPDVSRTTNGTGALENMSSGEISALDAGIGFSQEFAGTRVPFLGEVLAWAKGKIDLAVEIKGNPFPAEGVEAAVVDEITRYGMEDNVVVICFYHPVVKKVKEIAPHILTGILYTGRAIDPAAMARAAGADSIRCDWHYLAKEDVDKAHAAGLWVSCWTADSEDVFSRLAEIGVDSAGCNYPDRFRKWLDERNLGIR
ncbi:glycerophosphodiester phosphodiesterase [Breznakiella homolactica]|uniref:GP-PDE domain-containing protein n=1 Tax=Breznakiella homolactica TaxID=2798577 RepID=A0A7T7XPB4_9SPIR|nr:glycerophosphodiester phosphodiesterase family protein [Breznakiella homolactica]QQO09907.1 hypothetical protein JFL75_03070 [Breznakiella homolactica]